MWCHEVNVLNWLNCSYSHLVGYQMLKSALYYSYNRHLDRRGYVFQLLMNMMNVVDVNMDHLSFLLHLKLDRYMSMIDHGVVYVLFHKMLLMEYKGVESVKIIYHNEVFQYFYNLCERNVSAIIFKLRLIKNKYL